MLVSIVCVYVGGGGACRPSKIKVIIRDHGITRCSDVDVTAGG
jgi:hypothetical protein